MDVVYCILLFLVFFCLFICLSDWLCIVLCVCLSVSYLSLCFAMDSLSLLLFDRILTITIGVDIRLPVV